jgi:hypothetical protein
VILFVYDGFCGATSRSKKKFSKTGGKTTEENTDDFASGANFAIFLVKLEAHNLFSQ